MALILSVLLFAAAAATAVLATDSPLGEKFPNTTFLRVSADARRELIPGSGGSCRERPAEFFVAPSAAGNLLSAPDAALVNSLRAGADIPIPAGTQGIRTLMSDLTMNTGNEVALVRLSDGTRVLRMGGPGSVTVGSDVETIIAHTHPSGRLSFSPAVVGALNARGQYSSVIIDPNANMGARIPVPRRSP